MIQIEMALHIKVVLIPVVRDRSLITAKSSRRLLENMMHKTIVFKLCLMVLLLGSAHEVLAQQNPIVSASSGQASSQASPTSNQSGQAAASIGKVVDNISTFAVAPLDTLNQWAAYAKGYSGGELFGNLGNAMDLGASALKITSAEQQGHTDAAAGEAEQYVATAAVRNFVVDAGGGAAGPVGEMVAGGAFALGQMAQKLPCNGGTVQDCVTDLEVGVYTAFRDTSVSDIKNAITSYFGDSTSDGLESGGADQTLFSQSGDAPTALGALVGDSVSAAASPAALNSSITAADLAAIGANSTASPSLQTSLAADAQQLPGQLQNWDQQQAAAEAVRQAELQRLQAQQAAEEQARQQRELQAAQAYSQAQASQQASYRSSTPTDDSDSAPPQASSSSSGWRNNLQQGMSLVEQYLEVRQARTRAVQQQRYTPGLGKSCAQLGLPSNCAVK